MSEANGGEPFDTLSDALSYADSVLLAGQKKGGMTIKYVQSSDNKYVQYFLPKDEWSANEADWEKMNLEEEVSQLGRKVDDLNADVNGVDETVYENTGQVAYYKNIGTYNTRRGIGIYTPAFALDKKVNRIKFPPIKSSRTSGIDIEYLVAYGDKISPMIPSSLTPIITGTILTVTTEGVEDYEIGFNDVTIPQGKCVFIFLYYPSNDVFLLGGGNGVTTEDSYNSDDCPIYFILTKDLQLPFSENWSLSNSYISNARFKGCNPILYYKVEGLTQKVNGLSQEVKTLSDNYEELQTVKLYLPNKLYAVVGDTLQLFFQGIIGVVNISDYDIFAECSKGNTYTRYFSYTPTVDDIGTTTLTVYVKDRNNNILGQASCAIVTVSAPSSPDSLKRIFTFGDSLTRPGKWPGEAKRRLVGTSVYDGIGGDGLSNIQFYGYNQAIINGQVVDFFGVGGWTWKSYISKGTGGAFRFFVEGVSSLSIGATYTNNEHTYTIQEINVTGDSGEIRCTTSSTSNVPSASGTLTKVIGDGDAIITFNSFEVENANPLWDVDNNKMSFIPYVQNCGATTIDAVYVLLTWNGIASWADFSVNDITGHIADAKTFARTLHTEYPSAKLFIMGIQMPSITGGLGKNYGASGDHIDTFGQKQAALNYNKALQDLCNLAEFSPYCEFVAIAPQFDSLYNMPYTMEKVNTRNSQTEMLGRNGLHPADPGYYQIADAVYRSIVANFCQ